MMKRLLTLLVLVFPLLAGAEEKPLKVCLVSASAEYDSHASLAKLQTDLESKGAVCFRAFGEDKGNGIPGFEKLAESDVMVLFTRRVVLPPDQLDIMRKYVEAGKPIVGIRTASHAIQNWLPDVKVFDHEVLGGSYDNHYSKDENAVVTIEPEHAAHPVLGGVTGFSTEGKLYKNPKLADDAQLLLTAKNESGNLEPVAWTHPNHGGKVFYTSLGVPKDFENPVFRRLLVNAVFWTAVK